MRRREAVRIGDALSDFFKRSPTIARKLAEARIPDVWPQLVGSVLASYTTRVVVKDGRLFVYMSSSIARHEVFMQRAQLKEGINRAIGVDVLTTIIVK